MPKKKTKAKRSKAAAGTGRLIPAEGTVVIRMYRIGHGDCFLLAFGNKKDADPVYVLIDCGYKPGSPKYIGTTPAQVTASIREATGGQIDVAIVTHEHQDHVNAITAANFKDITITEAWFAWSEDPDDDVANELRKAYKDKLLGLIAARNRLQAAGDGNSAERIDRFLAFELGGEDEMFSAAQAERLLSAVGNASTSKNKQSMKLLKDTATKTVRFLRPHERVRSLPGADGVRVFVLGPPRNDEQLTSMNPEGEEGFRIGRTAAATPVGYFGAAARAGNGSPPLAPFAPRFCVSWQEARTSGEHAEFFSRYYGSDGDVAAVSRELEVPTNAEWRRIDKDWLYSAEQLALDMNNFTNNTSLVLAFELSRGGKVLLFAADAQRGNWVSWNRKAWKDGDRTVTARDLLSRTVLYKVGHHGSHNATLNGTAAEDWPNLGWIALGDHAQEFTAMITAVRAWAETQDGWDHPMKAIKDALLKRAGGRVFQTDTDLEQMTVPEQGVKVEWDSFLDRTVGNKLFFDYKIEV